MYDKHLDSFIRVVERGSFSKAARDLFISPNALAKQIDLLERDVGATLLVRSAKGVSPTPAGNRLYRRALEITALSKQFLTEVRGLEGAKKRVIRLASSQMRPTDKIGAWWKSVQAEHPHLSVSIVPVPDDIGVWPNYFDNMGNDIDVALAIQPGTTWKQHHACALRDIYRSKRFVAIPCGNSLCERKHVSLKDLEGSQLHMVPKGITQSTDTIRETIENEELHIRIVEGPPYDLGAFNRCAEDNIAMLIPEEWLGVHPSFAYIPLDGVEDYTFSLIYAPDRPPEIDEFIDAVAREAMNDTGIRHAPFNADESHS